MKPFQFVSTIMLLRVAAVLLLLLVNACSSATSLDPDVGKVDSDGCPVPPPAAFQASKIDFEFAQSNFGKTVFGGVKLNSETEFYNLIGQAVTDERVLAYLRCRAQKEGYTSEQVLYLDRLAGFRKTSPTAEQFILWCQQNPAPVGAPQNASARGVSKSRPSANYSVVYYHALNSGAGRRRLSQVLAQLGDLGFSANHIEWLKLRNEDAAVTTYVGDNTVASLNPNQRRYVLYPPGADGVLDQLKKVFPPVKFQYLKRSSDSEQVRRAEKSLDRQIDVVGDF